MRPDPSVERPPGGASPADGTSDESGANAPRAVLADCLLPTIALLFTLYYLSTITEVPWISQASAAIVSVLLLLSILAFAVRTLVRVRAGTETLSVGAALSARARIGKITIVRLVLLALAIAYVGLLPWLGFTLGTFLFVLAAIVLLSSVANWKRALAVALGCSTIGYVVFIHFFGTRFPEGPIERWMDTLLG